MRLSFLISHIITSSSSYLCKYCRLLFLVNKYNSHVMISFLVEMVDQFVEQDDRFRLDFNSYK